MFKVKARVSPLKAVTEHTHRLKDRSRPSDNVCPKFIVSNFHRDRIKQKLYIYYVLTTYNTTIATIFSMKLSRFLIKKIVGRLGFKGLDWEIHYRANKQSTIYCALQQHLICD